MATESVEGLPVGSVVRASYYPPTFGLGRATELATIQLTRGRNIAHGERAEYPLTQRWERIEVLWTPTEATR